MTGVQVFLMGFGAVLAVIGVVVFFLLAWFKETTGQDHHNAIKILQAEFRFSNPALVIFAGGLLLMVVPFFIGNNTQGAPPPTPTPVNQAAPTAAPVAEASPAPTPAPQPTPASVAVVAAPTDTPAPPTPAPAPADTPIPPTPAPALTLSPTTLIIAAPDPTGWWRNETGSLEFRRLRGDEFAYSDFDSLGNQVGQGTATQYEDTLQVSGDGFLIDGFGNPYYVIYTGYMVLEGDVMEGDLYEAFSGNYLGSVFFTRDSRSSGQ